jgi:phosphatidylinositol glycan class S
LVDSLMGRNDYSIRHLGSSTRYVDLSNQVMSLLGAPKSGSLLLRLITLGRVSSAGLLLKASGTMGTLACLTLALPSISILQSVLEEVHTTI